MKIGLFLGMGQVAGAEFYRHFVMALRDLDDHERPTIIAYDNPRLPRKDKSVSGGKDEALPGLKEGMDFFKRQGVDCVLAPCNTVMFYRKELEQYSALRIPDIIEITALYVNTKFPNKKIGLLATDATLSKGLYHRVLHSPNILTPDAQKSTMLAAIDRVKRAHIAEARQDVVTCLEELKSKGAEVIILGCTELGVAYRKREYQGIPVIDSNQVYAYATANYVKQILARSSPSSSPSCEKPQKAEMLRAKL